ncbi:MAG TPA: hypothetical protein VLS25_06680 [Dehalococcoidia bacterium]|nr:hypothetical protein [Dehalococcoidia bacterium]
MSFATEWALAIHRAVWFPLLWMTGLEARAMEAPFIDEATVITRTAAGCAVDASKSCLGTRASRSTAKRRPRARPAARVRHRA